MTNLTESVFNAYTKLGELKQKYKNPKSDRLYMDISKVKKDSDGLKKVAHIFKTAYPEIPIEKEYLNKSIEVCQKEFAKVSVFLGNNKFDKDFKYNDVAFDMTANLLIMLLCLNDEEKSNEAIREFQKRFSEKEWGDMNKDISMAIIAASIVSTIVFLINTYYKWNVAIASAFIAITTLIFYGIMSRFSNIRKTITADNIDKTVTGVTVNPEL